MAQVWRGFRCGSLGMAVMGGAIQATDRQRTRKPSPPRANAKWPYRSPTKVSYACTSSSTLHKR